MLPLHMHWPKAKSNRITNTDTDTDTHEWQMVQYYMYPKCLNQRAPDKVCLAFIWIISEFSIEPQAW